MCGLVDEITERLPLDRGENTAGFRCECELFSGGCSQV